MIEWSTVAGIGEAGFTGFSSIDDLLADDSELPSVRGVYVVVRPHNSPPEFLVEGTGGFFKGRDPNVSLKILADNWVQETVALYIGKAGSAGSQATLKSRLRQYLRFGQGKKVGHWGGRYIWQLGDATSLLLCWWELPSDDPRAVESRLIEKFEAAYTQMPFANLSH